MSNEAHEPKTVDVSGSASDGACSPPLAGRSHPQGVGYTPLSTDYDRSPKPRAAYDRSPNSRTVYVR